MTAGRTNTQAISQQWCTPRKYVEAITQFFGGIISLDPCSNEYSIVNAETEYSLPEVDGLSASWNYPTIYVNPPYGRDKVRGTNIRMWLEKCSNSHHIFNSEVIALVPVATNTRHWKENVFGSACAISFLYDTRLKFLINGLEEGKGAPMSCALIYWGDRFDCFDNIFTPFGAVVDIRNLQGRSIGNTKHRYNDQISIL